MFGLLGTYSPNKVLVSLIVGGIGALSHVMLIALLLPAINYDRGGNDPIYFLGVEIHNFEIAIIFFALCFQIFLLKVASQYLLALSVLDMAEKIRLDIYETILTCSIKSMEKIGAARFTTAVSRDVGFLLSGAGSAPIVIQNSITLIAMLFYIRFVNESAFKIILSAIVVSAISYQLPMFFARRLFSRVGRLTDNIQFSFNGLIDGAKELKLSEEKRNFYVTYNLKSIEAEIKKTGLKAQFISIAAVNYGDIINFLLMGFFSFIFINYYQINTSDVFVIVIILVYMASPMASIVNYMPVYYQAKASLVRINKLLSEIDIEKYQQASLPRLKWKKISLDRVSYAYSSEEGNFKLGPISLEIQKGEITMVVGGNGSGKSTIGKLITQHYRPTSGNIFFDDCAINNGNINSFRETLASIYSDYFLFERNSFFLPHQEIAINDYLIDFGLSEKVKFKDGRFSTTKLSDGQRRRLALIVALIEDKDLYLFDEWAADQDPIFRDYFYKKVLPDLKDKGKAVIVISHDERYFNIADRIVKVYEGQVISCTVPATS